MPLKPSGDITSLFIDDFTYTNAACGFISYSTNRVDVFISSTVNNELIFPSDTV